MSAYKVSELQVLAVLFVLVVAVEVGLATASTTNYFQFYKALGQTQVSLVELQVVPVPSSQTSQVSLVFSVENPTSYQPIVMQDFSIGFTVTNSTNGGTLVGPLQQAARGQSGPLDPNIASNVTMNFALPIPAKDTQFTFTVTMDLSTFLDSLELIQSTYGCTTGQPQLCQLMSTTTTSPVSPGGGGGGMGL